MEGQEYNLAKKPSTPLLHRLHHCPPPTCSPYSTSMELRTRHMGLHMRHTELCTRHTELRTRHTELHMRHMELHTRHTRAQVLPGLQTKMTDKEAVRRRLQLLQAAWFYQPRDIPFICCSDMSPTSAVCAQPPCSCDHHSQHWASPGISQRHKCEGQDYKLSQYLILRQTSLCIQAK